MNLTDEHRRLLDEDGWDIEGESPFEIRNREVDGFASGVGAECVVELLVIMHRTNVASH